MVKSATEPAPRRHVAKMVAGALRVYGLDCERLWRSILGLPRFIRAALAYHRLNHSSSGMSLRLRHVQPYLADWFGSAGEIDAEYFYQDWWVARQVFLRNPSNHLDIGSRLDGLVSHLLVFRSIEFVDIRQVRLDILGFSCMMGDARDLQCYQSASFESVSCLHAIEHIGLGRYGDPVDPAGPRKAASEICRLVAPGGYVYVSAPIGRERLEFNGQRVFAPKSMLEMFPGLHLEMFSAIDDNGRFWEDSNPDSFATSRDACGIFVFRCPA